MDMIRVNMTRQDKQNIKHKTNTKKQKPEHKIQKFNIFLIIIFSFSCLSYFLIY